MIFNSSEYIFTVQCLCAPLTWLSNIQKPLGLPVLHTANQQSCTKSNAKTRPKAMDTADNQTHYLSEVDHNVLWEFHVFEHSFQFACEAASALCVTNTQSFTGRDTHVVEYGLTSHQTHYRSYRGRFLRVRWPNQQCQALKDNSWSVHQVKGQSPQTKPSTR